jgi:DNA polymerase
MGKIAVLALGFQGGHRAFINMAEDYGAKVSVEKATQIKDHWRAANPKIVQLWYNLNDTCKKAILNKGTPFITNKLMFKVEGDWLRMRMPSTRRLSYYKPRIENDEIVYLGAASWCRTRLKQSQEI